jgi:ribosomal protein L22
LALQKELNIKQKNKNKMEKSVKLNKKAKKGIKKLEEKGKNEEGKIKELTETKSNEKNSEIKDKAEKPEEKKKKRKATAVVNALDIPISTKQSAAICRFIRGKKIQDAISDLEQVIALKKSVPMKGEIPHRKGKGIASGRFPKKAAERFIKILRSVSANAVNNDIENPVIIKSVANIGSRPWGKFGQVRRKRTHIIIVAGTRQNKQDKIEK